jgi:pseudouridine-5'-phosphate glycosidase
VIQGALSATTVGGTLAVCRLAGIAFMATGGTGGVHRRFAASLDISADLLQIARTGALVVSSGVKSILDVAATAELLETLGVPVLGWRTGTLPLFYSATGGPPVSAVVTSAEEAALIAAAHWQLNGPSGLLLTRPPEPSLEIEPVIAEAVDRVNRQGVRGQEVTPAVLALVHELTGGRSAEVNRQLIEDNAALAGEVAVAYAATAGTAPSTGAPLPWAGEQSLRHVGRATAGRLCSQAVPGPRSVEPHQAGRPPAGVAGARAEARPRPAIRGRGRRPAAHLSSRRLHRPR